MADVVLKVDKVDVEGSPNVVVVVVNIWVDEDVEIVGNVAFLDGKIILS